MATPTLTMTEADLLAAVLDLCQLRRVLVYHTHDSRRSQPGFPDLVIAGSKGILFRELKSDGGRLTKEQAKWLVTLGITGNAATWRPGDLTSGRIAAEIAAVR